MSLITKPELVFALAGPIGTDLHLLAQTLQENLAAYGYNSSKIRVSSLIEQFCDDELKKQLSAAKLDRRIKLLMAAGDALRVKAGSGSGLVPLIAAAIRTAREAALKKIGVEDTTAPAANHCYIIDSLKNPDEVDLLRKVYGENFVIISAFSSQKERKARLCNTIARSHVSTKDDAFDAIAQDLVDIDAHRPGERIGQNLRDTFPLADFFLRVDGDTSGKLSRFLDLLFSSPYITPTRDEFLMYEAKAKSYRSADLSRQIGAVIVNRDGHLVTSGCNEVPIAGGGSYWPDMSHSLDNRDYKKERDFNAVKKVEIIEELLRYLNDSGIMTSSSSSPIEEVVQDLLFGGHKDSFKDLRVTNLIEFGRVVHAEMNAITDAARRGIAIDSGSIYSTTFPCHMCARHIIAAGIKRVIYIEPYPKSMTEELYPEIVIVDDNPAAGSDGELRMVENVVRFEPFEGVAPSLYPDLFRAAKRKDQQGYTVTWSKSSGLPKLARASAANLRLELTLSKAVESLTDVGLEHVSQAVGGMEDADHKGENSPAKSA